jgi:hypothetical protein
MGVYKKKAWKTHAIWEVERRKSNAKLIADEAGYYHCPIATCFDVKYQSYQSIHYHLTRHITDDYSAVGLKTEVIYEYFQYNFLGLFEGRRLHVSNPQNSQIS